MELYARDMFFHGNNDREQVYDCCIHGKVIFKIEDKLLSDDTEWCVSASAYRFLHTLFKNHFMGAEDFMIPCCGHTMIPSSDGLSVNISGCGNGIDFDIIHEEETIVIITAGNDEFRLPFDEYKSAVLSFAEQVMDFYKANPPREFEDDFDRQGYSAFVAEWYSLYDKAISTTDNISKSRPLLLKIMMLVPKMKLQVFAEREFH